MTEAAPLPEEPASMSASPIVESSEAPTSAAEMHRLKSEAQMQFKLRTRKEHVDPGSQSKMDDPNTVSWLEGATLDESKGGPQKPPLEDYTSDPRKLSIMERFDRDTKVDSSES